MAMVEVPGGSAVGGRSNHDRRTTPFFLEGRLEKAERRARSGKNKSPRMTRPPSLYHSFLDCTDPSRKSLYVITYDDQQRNFGAAQQYYGIFWSEGPEAVNARAIALWPEFDGYQGELGEDFRGHRDSEENIDGAATKPGKCYSGFACFGYGEVAISLAVEELSVNLIRTLQEVYGTNLLKEALALVNKCPGFFDEVMEQLRKNPNDDALKRQMHDIIGGPEPELSNT